ncbi:MAG: virulence protein RhuM/Fic/DOC family protein [Bacteroidales bacterium]|nr:virulence protein RhuM/Fic/DOC family protein [Bacteroidales bacterium]
MSEVIKYIAPETEIELEVGFERDTVWLSQDQMVALFQRDQSVISRHIKNVFIERELDEKSNMQKMHIANSDKPVMFYNLDVIISVGYRVKSLRGTQFRIWATKILKEKLLESVRRKSTAEELVNVVKYIGRITQGRALEKEEAVGLLYVITDYSHALEMLDKYDHQLLELKAGLKESTLVTVEEIRQLIAEMKTKFGGSALFGLEKDRSLESSVTAIYQTYDGKELYPSPEIKAANLLYFLVKNHSFVDGNKRIAAASFIFFLHKNNLLYSDYGAKIIDNNTLVALTLMLAESNPADREMLVKVVVNLLNR